MTARAADGSDLDVPGPPPTGAPPSASSPMGGPPLRRASELTGLDVVSLAGEREVEVKDVVFDKARGRLTGFTLRKPGLLGGPQKRVLPVEAVIAVGRDAVMVEGADAFVAPEALAASGEDVIGDRVITDAGVELGTVTDVVVAVRGGEADIVGFEVDPTLAARPDGGGPVFVPLPVALAISGEVVVVPAAAEALIAADLASLDRSSHRLRDEVAG